MGGKTISSQSFVSQLVTADGAYKVFFSGPTLGNRVVGIAQVMTADERRGGQPAAVIVKQLEAEYGKPSYSTDVDVTTSMAWNFGSNSQLSCSSDAPCSDAGPSLTMANLAPLQAEFDHDRRLVLSALLLTDPGDARPVSGYSVTLEDVANELRALREAEKQMTAQMAPPR